MCKSFLSLLVLITIVWHAGAEASYWDCKISGTVKDSQDKNLQDVAVTGSLYILNDDGSQIFYKDLLGVSTDSSGKFILKYEVDNNDEIISVIAKLKFSYQLEGVNIMENKEILLQANQYFGQERVNVIMKFRGMVGGLVRDKVSGIAMSEASVKAIVDGNSLMAMDTVANSKGEYSMQIELSPSIEQQIVLTVTAKDTTKYIPQEFKLVLGPANKYMSKEMNCEMLPKGYITLQGQVVDGKGKKIGNGNVKINVGEGEKAEKYQIMTNAEGMFEKVLGNFQFTGIIF